MKMEVERVDRGLFNGKATEKEITLTLGTNRAPRIQLLLVVPNHRAKPAPVFVGLNFCGNHTVLADSRVALPTAWMPTGCPGVTNNHATVTGCGAQVDVRVDEQSICRGYAVATFYNCELVTDHP